MLDSIEDKRLLWDNVTMLDNIEDRRRQRREAARRWREAHREQERRRREAHREEINAAARAYRKANPEKIHAARRKYEATHREEINAAQRAQRAARKEAARLEAEHASAAQRQQALEARQRAADEHMAKAIAAMNGRNSKLGRLSRRCPEYEVILWGRRYWPRELNELVEYDFEMLRSAWAFFDDARRVSRHEPDRHSQSIVMRGLLWPFRNHLDGPKMQAIVRLATTFMNAYQLGNEADDLANRPPPTVGV
jgi:hypothetical protein